MVVPRLHRASLLALIAVVTAPSGAHAASASISGRITGPLPSAGRGEATVRAYDVRTGALVRADVADRRGAFRLPLQPGNYLLHATSIRDRGVISERLVPVTLASRQQRRGVRISPASVRAATQDTPPAAQPSTRAPAAPNLGARTTYRIDDFTAPTGSLARLGRALPALITTDVAGAEACTATQVIGAREETTLRSTSRLRRSKLFTPRGRVTRRLIEPQLTVRGSLRDGTQSGRAAFTVQIVERRTGRVLDTLEGSLRRSGAGLFTDQRRLAAALAERLCRTPPAYRVALALSGRGEYTAYNATARIDAAVVARTQEQSGYRSWAGNGQFTWTDNLFRSRVTPCPATTIKPGSGGWAANVTRTSAERVRVALDLTASEYTAYSKATFTCGELLTITDAPGAILTGTAPRTFELPLLGGTGAISSTTTVPTGGFIQQGTVTVTPVWSRGLPGA